MDVLVVYKRSAYSFYVDSPDEDIQKYMESGDENAEDLLRSHETQERSLETVMTTLEKMGVSHRAIYRADLDEGIDADMIVTVGGDGTLIETSHYVSDIPLFGVNSNPGPSVGYFSCCNATDFERAFGELDKAPRHTLNRLELVLNGVPIREQIDHAGRAKTCYWSWGISEHSRSVTPY